MFHPRKTINPKTSASQKTLATDSFIISNYYIIINILRSRRPFLFFEIIEATFVLTAPFSCLTLPYNILGYIYRGVTIHGAGCKSLDDGDY